MFVNDKNGDNVARGVEYDAAGILSAAEDRIKNRLLVAEQEAQKILRGDEGEAVYFDAQAQWRANKILREARRNAVKRKEETINEAEDKAKRIEQEKQSGKFEDIRSQMLLEARHKIIEHTDSIISEAEQTALRILSEAKERARHRTAIYYDNFPDSRNVEDHAIKIEANAPNLLAELRKRYAEITFGEPHVSQTSSGAGENTDSSTIEFSVLEGENKDQIGRYVVHTSSRGIVGKMYEHWGKLLMIRGRVSDWDYQYLQKLTDRGQLQDELRNRLRDGMRNFVIYNLPVFVWSAARGTRGREDRYINDFQFP
jgi:vacuolar-type H+-ATPase subunit H